MADAITERISQAFAKIIRGLNLTPAPTAVVFRKRPMKLDGDGLPLIVVSVGDEEAFEPLGTGSKANLLLWSVRRPVAIAIGFASEGEVADNPELRVYRDACWAINAPMLQATGFFSESGYPNDVAPAGKAIFNAEALKKTGVDWSLIDLVLETLEERPR